MYQIPPLVSFVIGPMARKHFFFFFLTTETFYYELWPCELWPHIIPLTVLGIKIDGATYCPVCYYIFTVAQMPTVEGATQQEVFLICIYYLRQFVSCFVDPKVVFETFDHTFIIYLCYIMVYFILFFYP